MASTAHSILCSDPHACPLVPGNGDGTKSLTYGDEDDQERPCSCGDDNKVHAGSVNLSNFSMYGRYNTQGKGFVPNRSMTRLTEEYKKAIVAFRKTHSGNKLLNEVREYHQSVYSTYGTYIQHFRHFRRRRAEKRMKNNRNE